MLCPVCKVPTIIVEYDEIELDYCTNCCGVWFDAGELELLLASADPGGPQAFLDSVLGAEAGGATEKKHRCPICNLKMKKSFIDRQDRTLVDICPDGHGIWFDGGEVEGLLASLAGERPGENAAYRKLREFFGQTLKARPTDSP
jgi:Zn-finger nucleic acid-binding protein